MEHWYRIIFRLGASDSICGPSIILGYAIGGLIAFLIMRHLGEMIVEEPVADRSAILLINIEISWIFSWMELLDTLRSGRDERTYCGSQIY